LDFEALKAAAEDCALVFDMQLKMVVFPEFVSPTIPHCKAIWFTGLYFLICKITFLCRNNGLKSYFYKLIN